MSHARVAGKTATALGIGAGRRPSMTMIRRSLQALDPDRLTATANRYHARDSNRPPQGPSASPNDFAGPWVVTVPDGWLI